MWNVAFQFELHRNARIQNVFVCALTYRHTLHLHFMYQFKLLGPHEIITSSAGQRGCQPHVACLLYTPAEGVDNTTGPVQQAIHTEPLAAVALAAHLAQRAIWAPHNGPHGVIAAPTLRLHPASARRRLGGWRKGGSAGAEAHVSASSTETSQALASCGTALNFYGAHHVLRDSSQLHQPEDSFAAPGGPLLFRGVQLGSAQKERGAPDPQLLNCCPAPSRVKHCGTQHRPRIATLQVVLPASSITIDEKWHKLARCCNVRRPVAHSGHNWSAERASDRQANLLCRQFAAQPQAAFDLLPSAQVLRACVRDSGAAGKMNMLDMQRRAKSRVQSLAEVLVVPT